MFPLLGEGGCATTVGEEPGVAPAASSTVGGQPTITVLGEVGEEFTAVHVTHDRALGNLHLEIGPPAPVLVLAHAVHTTARDSVRVITEGEQ